MIFFLVSERLPILKLLHDHILVEAIIKSLYPKVEDNFLFASLFRKQKF